MHRGARSGAVGTRVGFFRAFLGLAGPYWHSDEKWKVRGLVAVLVALTLGQVLVPIAINLWSASLFDALEQKAVGRMLPLLGALLLILLGNLVVTTSHLRVKRRLQLDWRRWLTRRLLDDWMRDGRHYLVGYMPGEHDNPDGRIAEDIRITIEAAIDLAHSLLFCILLLISFTQILWSLSGDPVVTIAGVALWLPGHLVWAALLYAAAGTSVALLLGRPLVRAMNARQTNEADFRFGLAHARENAEAIALLAGEADERRRLRGLFVGVGTAWDRQTAALTNVFLFTSVYSVLSIAFPVLVAAPRYLAGTITLGVLMQTAQAFQQMTAALSWPIDNLSRGAEWRASVERVLGLEAAIGGLTDATGRGGDQGIRVEASDHASLVIRDLVITEPDGTLLVGPFGAVIEPGERLLIGGDPGGAFKLFKAVARVWPWGTGRIELPGSARLFFMPQQPYLPIGPLREALACPAPPGGFADAELSAALAQVGLDELELDDADDWSQVLSPGEQQRFGFARLLLHRPDWIFIQEATDALDAEGEAEMMGLLATAFPAATIVTIGFHAGLEAYHDRRLTVARANGHGVVAVASGVG